MPGIKKLARRAGLQTDDVQSVFDALTVILSQGESVRVPNFGTFSSKVQEPRTVTTPVLANGQVTTPRRKVIRYKMSATLREDWRME